MDAAGVRRYVAKGGGMRSCCCWCNLNRGIGNNASRQFSNWKEALLDTKRKKVLTTTTFIYTFITNTVRHLPLRTRRISRGEIGA
jgi:hypothetical protein